jgi:hypothetical protein
VKCLLLLFAALIPLGMTSACGPNLMAHPDAWIYQIGTAGLERVSLEDTEALRGREAVPERPATPGSETARIATHPLYRS